jgi:hypothetical protein
MSELRDLFIKFQDSSSTGAPHRPHALRFPLGDAEFDVLMLWDTMFADAHRFMFLLHLCTAIIRCQRDRLLAADFGRTMKLLQNYPPTDMRVLVDAAYDISAEESSDGVPSTPTSMSPAPMRPKSSPRTTSSTADPSLAPSSTATALQQPHAVAISVASTLHRPRTRPPPPPPALRRAKSAHGLRERLLRNARHSKPSLQQCCSRSS